MYKRQATRYTPVPLDEFCENRVRRLQELKEELLREPVSYTHLAALVIMCGFSVTAYAGGGDESDDTPTPVTRCV